MHHFKAKGGTVFNFNSDLSGPVHVWGPVQHDGGGIERAGCWVADGDLLEFVDWYRKTPGYGAPDPEDDPAQTRIRELEQIALEMLAWMAREASGFDSEAIDIGKRAGEVLRDAIAAAEAAAAERSERDSQG